MTTSLRVAAQSRIYSYLVFALLIAGCVSSPERASRAAKPEFGVEQLLRLPVTKGQAGVDEVVHILQRLYGVSEDTQLSPQTNTKTPLMLADGVVLSKVFVDKGPTGWLSVNMGVNLDVANPSCLTVENAAALIGAKKTNEYKGDGVGYAGHTEYSFDNRNIRINLVAIHPGPHCLGAVWIYKKFP